jgi:hypothetical protein
MPPASDELLTQLEDARNRVEPGSAALIGKLLTQISKIQFDDPRQLIRFHESLLFLRAFPHHTSHTKRTESILNSFHRRIEKLQELHVNLSAFDEFDTSGIAGTTMQDTLSYDVANWLARRIPRNVEIAWNDFWDDYQSERARGTLWPKFIPLLEEDAEVEANIPWTQWLDVARGRKDPLPWLLDRFSDLSLTRRERAELYDSLRLPLRWKLENLKLSRTLNWSYPRSFYIHDTPLIQRSEVSLVRELARPAPKLEKLSTSAGASVMHAIREVMVVRYRELYGTTLGDPRSVVRADLGRGVIMYFWGLPAERRLPLRAYVAGYTLKNGVPINYIEAIGLCEWIEVGFNTFYTYRQGETAWIYAQALRCLRALTRASCISIYPYQIGENNEEAIDSGAFWFYRKLGFRSGRHDLQKLCESEEKKIAASKTYRTPPRTLKRLAQAHMFYEVQTPGAPESNNGEWDTFSIRNIGLLVNRRMAREFAGNAQRLREESTKIVTRALGINAGNWTQLQKSVLENWSPVMALIPDLARWSRQEKERLVGIIRAKSSASEMRYLRRTQLHSRLREELLRFGRGTNSGKSELPPS